MNYIKKFNENISNVVIRKSELGDVKFLTSIVNSPALNSYTDGGFSEEYISELVTKGYSIVAIEDSKIVGFIVGEKLISKLDLLLLHWVWRSPDAKSRNIFNQLMMECKKKFSFINSYINEDAINPFDKQGFSIGNKSLIEVCWSKK